MIDVGWFKREQRRLGVTSEEIAAHAGRSRTAVSNIYSGRQRMTLDWAKAFAEKLQQPLEEIMRRAGIVDGPTAQAMAPGFAESGAAPWIPKPGEASRVEALAVAFGRRPGVDVWQVRDGAMALQGLLPGDFMLVDTHAADRARAGDIVVAQVYDNLRGKAVTILRRFEPPVLVAASADPDTHKIHVVDGNNVLIRGRVISSWRFDPSA